MNRSKSHLPFLCHLCHLATSKITHRHNKRITSVAAGEKRTVEVVTQWWKCSNGWLVSWATCSGSWILCGESLTSTHPTQKKLRWLYVLKTMVFFPSYFKMDDRPRWGSPSFSAVMELRAILQAIHLIQYLFLQRADFITEYKQKLEKNPSCALRRWFHQWLVEVLFFLVFFLSASWTNDSITSFHEGLLHKSGVKWMNEKYFIHPRREIQ